MRTNIDIDDELMAEAMLATGEKTKKAVVEAGLRKLVQLNRQVEALQALRGIGWDGGAEKMPFLREFAEDGTPYDEK
jgi:Arc/MetJ family transcription regulator